MAALERAIGGGVPQTAEEADDEGGRCAAGRAGRLRRRLGSRRAQLAHGVWKLSGFPPDAINVYVMGDVLVDAATRHAPRRILSPDRAAAITATLSPTPIPITRAQARRSASGSASRLGAADDGRREERAIASGRAPPAQPAHHEAGAGPGHPVAARLDEGDEVAGFRCSTCPATLPATSPTGASPTAS